MACNNNNNANQSQSYQYCHDKTSTYLPQRMPLLFASLNPNPLEVIQSTTFTRTVPDNNVSRKSTFMSTSFRFFRRGSLIKTKDFPSTQASLTWTLLKLCSSFPFSPLLSLLTQHRSRWCTKDPGNLEVILLGSSSSVHSKMPLTRGIEPLKHHTT